MVSLVIPILEEKDIPKKKKKARQLYNDLIASDRGARSYDSMSHSLRSVFISKIYKKNNSKSCWGIRDPSTKELGAA